MRNPRNNRFRWLNSYRVASSVSMLILLVLAVLIYARPAQQITVSQATKIERAASFLQDVGFNNPVYLGIIRAKSGEGEYPTFQAEAIGGKPVKLFIRTTPNGGWEIQQVDMFETVASADDLARAAERAVSEWQNMPANIKPRTDGAYGEYEGRKFDYDHLSQYDPGAAYWQTKRNETRDWPRS